MIEHDYEHNVKKTYSSVEGILDDESLNKEANVGSNLINVN